MDIGAKIKQLRIDSNLGQKDLAQRLHISYKTVSSWETNRTQPKMEMIEEMCKIFQCKKTDFMDEPSYLEIVKKEHVASSLEFYVDKFEMLDSYGKEAVIDTIDREYKRCIDQDRKKESNIS